MCGNYENLWIEVSLNLKKIVIGVIYRHPKYNLTNFQNKLSETIQSLNLNKTTFYICSDINIDWLKKDSNSNINNYFELLENLGISTLTSQLE